MVAVEDETEGRRPGGRVWAREEEGSTVVVTR
jgi:hypothetical protein